MTMYIPIKLRFISFHSLMVSSSCTKANLIDRAGVMNGANGLL